MVPLAGVGDYMVLPAGLGDCLVPPEGLCDCMVPRAGLGDYILPPETGVHASSADISYSLSANPFPNPVL